jgi:hypothetical protein
VWPTSTSSSPRPTGPAVFQTIKSTGILGQSIPRRLMSHGLPKIPSYGEPASPEKRGKIEKEEREKSCCSILAEGRHSLALPKALGYHVILPRPNNI